MQLLFFNVDWTFSLWTVAGTFKNIESFTWYTCVTWDQSWSRILKINFCIGYQLYIWNINEKTCTVFMTNNVRWSYQSLVFPRRANCLSEARWLVVKARILFWLSTKSVCAAIPYLWFRPTCSWTGNGPKGARPCSTQGVRPGNFWLYSWQINMYFCW